MDDGGRTKGGLSLRSKLGYAMGDIYGGGSGTVIGILYLIFLTDVVRMPAAAAGVVLLVSKIWDAAIDPALGFLGDRTRTRWGRRRPYFLFGIPFIFASFAILWLPSPFAGEAARFVFAIAGYMGFTLVSSAVMIAYNALASELAPSYGERTALNAVRMVFSVASSLVCAVVPGLIVKAFPDPRVGYPVMGLAFGLLFALPYIFVFLWTRERPEFAEEAPAFDLRRLVVEPWKLRTFRRILVMYLFGQMTFDLLMAVIPFYMKYYIGDSGLQEPLLGIILGAQLLGVPLFSALAKKRSKRASYLVSSVVRIVGSALLFLLLPGEAPPLLFVLAALNGIGGAGSIVMIYAMLADLPDADELFSGERREGMYFGTISLLRQVSQALALFLFAQAIALTGYVAPVETLAGGATRLVAQAQPKAFVDALRVFMAVLPSLTVLACVWAALGYRLSPEVHARLVAVLEARRAKTAADQAEVAALEALL